MKIEQIIIDAVSVSKLSKIPVLFISNPGLGKTTILKKYAQHNGMHLETLIGSRFAPEEISGYQVNNGGDHLQHLSPEWFNRIWIKAKLGTPTLLFIDELSTCSEAVQGPLLSLIFDRTIGNEKFLPEDCLIVSAANYSANISSYMNILSPTLNRFCIINLNEEYNALDLVEEFLDRVDVTYPSVCNPMDEVMVKFFNERYKQFWKEVFIKYSDRNSPNGVLDISNQDIGGLYSTNGEYVYNFISGRSIYYLRENLKAYMELGLNSQPLLKKMINGLVGNGTCSFTENAQKERYNEHLISKLSQICSNREKKSAELVLYGDVAKDVANFIVNKDNLELSIRDEQLHVLKLVKEFEERFSFDNVSQNTKTKEQVAKFVTDMEALFEFYKVITWNNDFEKYSKKLKVVGCNFYGIYCDIIGTTPNWKKVFDISKCEYDRVVLIRILNSKGETVEVKRAVRQYSSYYELKEDETLDGSYLSTKYRLIKAKNALILVYKDGNIRFEPVTLR